MRATCIKWDVDYREDLEHLPQEVEIPNGLTDADEISDWLSAKYEYCHDGFILED